MSLFRYGILVTISLLVFSCATKSPKVIDEMNEEGKSAAFFYDDEISLGMSGIDKDYRESDGKELAQLLDGKIKNVEDHKTLSCPGTRLVLTCGNLVCESNKGESNLNCPSDCIPALVRSYNNQTLCTEAKGLYRPESTEDVVYQIDEAARKNLKVKVVGQLHSATNAICSDGVILSTEKMNKIYGLENFEGNETVRLQTGVILSDLTEWLHTQNRSIGYAVMGFRGVSIGGAIGTGSHGSSPKHNAIISNIVASVRIVDSFGQVHDFSEKTTEETTWKAVKASLGMLGVITEVRLKVQKQFNLDVRLSYQHEDEMFKDKGIMGVIGDCDFGQLNWFPGAKRFMKTCGKETTKKAEKGATNSLVNPSFPEFIVKPFKQILQLGACSKGISCTVEQIRYWQMKWDPPFRKNNIWGKLKGAKAVVGPSHRMISSPLTPHQAGFFQMDWEIVVPLSKADAALKAVRDYAHQQKICLPLVGVFLRFALAQDETLLAHTVADGDFTPNEPVVFIEMPVYLPVGFTPEMKAAYDKVYEDFARMLVTDYSGRAHWGKNREWIFKLQQSERSYGDRVERFQTVVDELDPYGMFSNKFSSDVGISYH